MVFWSSFNFQVPAQCLAHTESQIYFLTAVEKMCYSKTYLRHFALKTRETFYYLKESVLPSLSPSNLKRVCVHLHPPTMGGSFQNCSLVPLPRLLLSITLFFCLPSYTLLTYITSQKLLSKKVNDLWLSRHEKWNETSKREFANMVGLWR